MVDTLLLSEELRWASDVRWRTDSTLLLAAGTRGVVEIDRTGAVLAKPISGGRRLGQLWMATRIGLSDRLLVGAAPFFSAVFQYLESSELPVQRDYAAILDVDVRDGAALILGARRDAAGRWAPDGAMAWIDDGRADPKPVHFSESGPSSEVVSWYGPIDLGAVRFLDDGSFVVVPGVERGVYLYSAEGRLLRSWDSLRIGIAEGCSLDADQRREVDVRMEPRWRYWNQHLIVEDVVAWEGSPALLVRRSSRGKTTWELRVLELNGEVRTVRLPISSTTGRTRARMDVRGSLAVVLLHESGRLDETPEFQPRILFMEVDE
ncbi:MAG: hypothetical protein ACC682_16165 [Gemmatimonadota bacterium]